MFIKDEIARRQLELIRQEIMDGAHFTKPWFDLDVEAYRAYREGITPVLPKPYCDDLVDRIIV